MEFRRDHVHRVQPRLRRPERPPVEPRPGPLPVGRHQVDHEDVPDFAAGVKPEELAKRPFIMLAEG